MDAMPTYDPQQVHNQGHGIVQFGNDQRLIVWFIDKPIQNGVKSKDANRPIFDNVPHVHIQQPGERDFLEIPATEEHAVRFPRQWAAYQTKTKIEMEGTPLSILFPHNAAIVETLRHMNVLSIEQLAGLNDTGVQNIGMGGLQFRELAQRFIKASEDGKGANEVLGRLEAAERKITELTNKNNALERALAETGDGDASPKPRRGRPPKVEAA